MELTFEEILILVNEAEEQKKLQQEQEQKELQALIDNQQRWEDIPLQILRSNHKDNINKLKYYECLQSLWEEVSSYALEHREQGNDMYSFYEKDINHFCISLKPYVRSLASWLYSFKHKGLKGCGFEFEECQSEIWIVVFKMVNEALEYGDSNPDLPFVYKLKHRVQKNLFPNIIRSINKDKRIIHHSKDIKLISLEQMAESGKEYPSKSYLVYDKIIDRIDTIEKDTHQSPQFNDKELVILEIWKTQPNISIRKLAEQTGISKSTIGRIIAGLKEKLSLKISA